MVEMHIHSIDVLNWALQAHPIKAVGVGGRGVRVDPSYGHIYDHLAIEYEYPNGVRALCMHRQQKGSSNIYTERVIGSKGTADLLSHQLKGETNWKFEQEAPNPYVQEHVDLINSIQSGQPLNEGRRVAESTLTAIMAREAAYTGQELTWEDVLHAEMDLLPPSFAFGEAPFPRIPMPGKTSLNRSWPA